MFSPLIGFLDDNLVAWMVGVHRWTKLEASVSHASTSVGLHSLGLTVTSVAVNGQPTEWMLHPPPQPGLTSPSPTLGIISEQVCCFARSTGHTNAAHIRLAVCFTMPTLPKTCSAAHEECPPKCGVPSASSLSARPLHKCVIHEISASADDLLCPFCALATCQCRPTMTTCLS